MRTIVKTWLGECPVGDMLQGECAVREVSVGEVSGRGGIRRGIILRGSVSLGSVHEKCQSGNCPYTNLSLKLSQRNYFKEL